LGGAIAPPKQRGGGVKEVGEAQEHLWSKFSPTKKNLGSANYCGWYNAGFDLFDQDLIPYPWVGLIHRGLQYW